MSKSDPTETDPAPGRSVIVLDGPYRGEIGHITATGGGLVWLQFAGERAPVSVPAASIGRAPLGRRVRDEPKP